MILKEQAAIIMGNLNAIVQDLYTENNNDNKYDIQFYITDNYQLYNKVTKLEDKEYIPAIVSRLDPFIPKSSAGVINDFLEIDSKYLFNLTNISKAKFKTNKLTIEYLDIEKQVILSRKFAVDLDISQTATISTLKDGSEILKVQYIRIVDY